jgi:hypothetical protein
VAPTNWRKKAVTQGTNYVLDTMNRFSILLGLFALSSTTIAQDMSMISYHDNALKWQNYKTSSKPSGYQKAFTYCGITYSVKSDAAGINVEFNAYVDANESWVLKGAATSQLLRHEQGLFDITELYARKMKKATHQYIKQQGANLNYESLLLAVREIYKELNNELFAEQQQYNVQTVNGGNLQAQIDWENKIKAEMNKLSDFASK